MNCNAVSSQNTLEDGQICYLNYDENISNYNIFVNGMISESERGIEILNKLQDSDANNLLIYNASTYKKESSFWDKIKSFFTDIFNTILGKVSPTLGEKSEIAVSTIMKFLTEKSNENCNIVLNAHSQGTILVQNALNLLKEKLSVENWNNLKEKLSINLYGTATRNFPDDLKITEWQTFLDYVSLTSDEKQCDENYDKKRVLSIGHTFERYDEAIKNGNYFDSLKCNIEKLL